MAHAITALQDLKVCPDCTEEFTDPRALPCVPSSSLHAMFQDAIKEEKTAKKKGKIIQIYITDYINGFKFNESNKYLLPK